MPSHYDETPRTFERELKRAERERKQQLLMAALAGCAVLAIALIAVAVVYGDSARDKAASEKTVASAPAIAPIEENSEAPAAVDAEEPAKEQIDVAAPEPDPELMPEPALKPAAKPKPAIQRLSVGLGQNGYDPSTLTAKAGVPIKLTVAQGEGCAAGFLIPSLGIAADNTSGPAVIDLPALEAGTYRFSCGMGMVTGSLLVR